jgi:hypothetical protein
MTTQHTPGPWKYLRTMGFDYGSTIYWIPGICTNVKDEANVRLISAAPDLLEALQNLFGADVEHVLMGDGKDDQIEAIAKARAAIAKATGESQ